MNIDQHRQIKEALKKMIHVLSENKKPITILLQIWDDVGVSVFA